MEDDFASKRVWDGRNCSVPISFDDPSSQDAGCLDTPDAVFGSAGFAHRNGMRIKVQNVIGTKSPVQIDLETWAELPDGIHINKYAYICIYYIYIHIYTLIHTHTLQWYCDGCGCGYDK